MSTSIRDEAKALGTVGGVAYKMMLKVFESQLHRFPRLAATFAPDELLNEFFEQRGAGYVIELLAEPDDEGATRLTHRRVEHWLVDEDRKLPMGALRNRIEKRLQRSPAFQPSAASHFWFLAGGPDEDRPATPGQLADVAASVEVSISISPNGNTQLGRKGQLEAMLIELLLLAGRLHVAHITSICANRFPSLLLVGDAAQQVDDDEWEAAERTTAADDVVSTVIRKQGSERTAEEIFALISPSDRIALRHAADAQELATSLGVGRSSAYSLIKQARNRVVELAGSASNSADVQGALIDLILDK